MEGEDVGEGCKVLGYWIASGNHVVTLQTLLRHVYHHNILLLNMTSVMRQNQLSSEAKIALCKAEIAFMRGQNSREK